MTPHRLPSETRLDWERLGEKGSNLHSLLEYDIKYRGWALFAAFRVVATLGSPVLTSYATGNDRDPRGFQ